MWAHLFYVSQKWEKKKRDREGEMEIDPGKMADKGEKGVELETKLKKGGD